MILRDFLEEYKIQDYDLALAELRKIGLEMTIDSPISLCSEIKIREKLSEIKALITAEEKEKRFTLITSEAPIYKELRKNEEQKRINEFILFMNKPLQEIFSRYNQYELLKKSQELDVKLPSSVQKIINYLTYTARSAIKDPYNTYISANEVNLLKYDQIKGFYFSKEWDRKVKSMAFSAELAFEKICDDLKLKVVDANKTNGIHCSYDYLVNNIKVDVKARCYIGGDNTQVSDNNLKKEFIDRDEVIAFFSVHSHQYEASNLCNLIGIYDRNLILKANLPLSESDYLNPLYFVDIKKYFKVSKRNNRPKITKEEIDFLIEKDLFDAPKLLELYEPISLLRILLKQRYFENFDDFIYKLIDLYNKEEELLTPYLIQNYLTETIELKKDIDTKLFETKVLPILEISTIQRDFVLQYLKIINLLKDDNLRCNFNEDKPLKECRIAFKDGGATILAIGDSHHHRNVLLTHSWYDGRILNLADQTSIRRHNHSKCACLIHPTKFGHAGRSNCPEFNKQTILENKARLRAA